MDHARRSLLFARPARGAAPIRPPWTTEASVLERCTGCGDCAAACPAGIILLRHGLPEVSFAAGECTFCTACAVACAAGVFAPPADAAAAFGHAMRAGAGCLAREGVVCQSCADLCPEAAIRFRPRAGGPALPDLDPAACTGCGACIAACPADAIAAVPRPEARLA